MDMLQSHWHHQHHSFPGRKWCRLLFCQVGFIPSIWNSLSNVNMSRWHKCGNLETTIQGRQACLLQGFCTLGPPCLGCRLIQGVEAVGLGYVCYGIWQSRMALWLFTQRKCGATSLWLYLCIFLLAFKNKQNIQSLKIPTTQKYTVP